MLNFGTGHLIAVPTNDSTGAAIANPTPVRLAALQDVSVDLSVDIKALYGGGKFPIGVGHGKAKTDIKAKYADISAAILGSLFFGKTATTGIKGAVVDFAGAVPATAAYTITPPVPSSGTWVQDLGVRNASTGAVMQRVASAPAAGQYSVAAGVYTFAAADASLAVVISFEYSASSSTGQIFNLTNDLMGFTPSFSMILQQKYEGKTLVLKFNRAVSGKLAMPFKNEDFAVYDFEATAFTDAADNLGYVCLF